MSSAPPDRCPTCGADEWSKRFSTGGGWRVVVFVCERCSYRISAA